MENIFVNEDNLCITGDIHLGNPFFKQSKSLVSFLDYLVDNNLNLCINGDGIDILQLSMAGISLDFPLILKHLELLASRNLKIYYIIGNHDIYLEHFFHRWKDFLLVPFLDVISGGKRIHIEHGHLHDDFFVKHPTAYKRITVFGGFFLKFFPQIYKITKPWKWLLELPARINHTTKKKPVDKSELIESAKGLLLRGFDSVIFGHSHYVAHVKMEEGGQYFNTGSWLKYPNHFIEVKKGNIELKTWE